MSQRPAARASRAISTALLAVAVVLVACTGTLGYQRLHRQHGLALTAEESRVLDAAKQDFITLQTFRRASFDKDFANASAVVTGSVRTNLTQSKAKVLSTLTTNKTNSSASIVSASVVARSGSTYQVLVLASLQTMNDAGKLLQSRPSPATLTMVHTHGTWLIDGIQLVSVS